MRRGTDNLEAYDLFLRGRQFWNKRTEADLQRAIGYFQQAIEKDPRFAQAYAGLGACYVVLPIYSGVGYQQVLPKARAAVRRAFELDPQSADGHAVLATGFDREGDFDSAELAYAKALSLNPNYATAHQWYAELLMDSGRVDQALAEIRLAQSLDPLSPTIQVIAARALAWNRNYEEALQQVERALQLSPDFPLAYIVRGIIGTLQKEPLEAIPDLEKARTLGASGALGTSSLLGYCYAATGRTSEALQVINDLKNATDKGYATSLLIAFVYQGLGDKDQMFAWLDRAASQPYQGVFRLRYSPLWDDVRSDPRYEALLKKHGLDK